MTVKNKIMARKGLEVGSTNCKGKMLHGGEMHNITTNSLVDKMQKGVEANRVDKAENGTERMQSYKMGGWTASK